MFLALALLACGGSVECRDGFAPSPDGHCYPTETVSGDSPSFADAFQSLPTCVPGRADGDLHLASACASGVCVGQTISEATEAMRREPICVPASQVQLLCQWTRGVEALVADQDRDLIPDPDAPITRVRIFGDYRGGTEDGLGIPVPASCYIEALGIPDRAVLVDVAGTLYPRELNWNRYGIIAYDLGTMGSGYQSGVIDTVYLYGAW